MDMKAGMHVESSYYNIDAGCYEPLVEPWLVNLQVLQKTMMTSQEVEIKSD